MKRENFMDFSTLEPQIEAAANFLKKMSSPKRLMILCALGDKAMSVSQLNEIIPLSQSALSQHLAALRDANLVKTRRDAQTIVYSIDNPASLEIIALLQKFYC